MFQDLNENRAAIKGVNKSLLCTIITLYVTITYIPISELRVLNKYETLLLVMKLVTNNAQNIARTIANCS